MARFYGRFDQANEATLDSDYFDKRTLGANSASGAALRDGLIVSRSALSAVALDDIPAKYEDGGIGTLIPVNLITTDNSTFLSWSAGYTSSLSNPPAPGIVIPADYRTRPTASITSSAAGLGDPFGGGGVPYATYTAATSAVNAVLNSFSNGQSPLTTINQGNNQSRTLFSIWHDAGLNYFGYDNFTPGAPQSLAATNTIGSTSPSSSAGSVQLSMSREYLNDFNPNGSALIVATLRYASSSGQSFTGINSTAASLSTTVSISSLTATANDAVRTYVWNVGTVLKNTGSLLDGQSSDGLNLHYTVTYYDSTITTSAGQSSTLVRNTGGTATVNGINLGGNSCFVKIGST